MRDADDQQIRPPDDLSELVRTKRILISVGAGGVGKTTVAASLGLVAARCGRRVLVLTIDPARRLAVSLGLEELDNAPREVPADKMAGAGAAPGSLQAMMLDQKRTFDEVIARHAPDQQTYERVLNNKLYRELSTRLAGGQEYAAIEKLYDVVQTSPAELLVLDTPPAMNAIDFLEAPKKMVSLLDGPAVQMFVRSYAQTGRFSFKLLARSANYVFRRIARFVGGRFLDDVAAFFGDMDAMLDGFRNRADEVAQLLGQPDVGFVVTTSPHAQAIDEAVALCKRLVARNISPAAFVINRVHLLQNAGESTADALREELARSGFETDRARELAHVLARSQEQMHVLAQADAEQIERLVRACGEQYPYIQVPLLDEDVHDIATLAVIGDYLATCQ